MKETKNTNKTKRERLAEKIIRLQEIINRLKKQWKTMSVFDNENDCEVRK